MQKVSLALHHRAARLLAVGSALVLSLFAACATFSTLPTPTPSLTIVATSITNTPAPVFTLKPEPSLHLVSIIVTAPAKILPGENAMVSVTLNPIIRRVTRLSDGGSYFSDTTWQDHAVAEMRFCFAADTPCALTDEWMRFSPTTQLTLNGDWLGARRFWLVAEFRQRDATLVPAVESYYAPQPNAQAKIALTLTVVLDTRTPIAAQPPAIQTMAAATRIAFPVTGGVLIEGGRCCVGAKTGETIPIHVEFDAASPVAVVTEMRIKNRCATEAEMNGAEWEPFAVQKTYPTTAVINFVGWYIAVQYRDARGNLSPVYCDDISVEGSP